MGVVNVLVILLLGGTLVSGDKKFTIPRPQPKTGEILELLLIEESSNRTVGRLLHAHGAGVETLRKAELPLATDVLITVSCILRSL